MHTSNRLTPVQWLICVIAAIGFAFDTYELLMFPLINRPALTELGHLEFGSAEYRRWLGLLFYVPALCGGVFGLLGGYLTDRLGRRRVLTWSILVYAFSAFAAGFMLSLALGIGANTAIFTLINAVMTVVSVTFARRTGAPRSAETTRPLMRAVPVGSARLTASRGGS